VAHDKHGNAVHVRDRVQLPNGEQHHVHGVLTDEGLAYGDNIAGAKFVEFAKNLVVIEKHASNVGKPDLGGGCIVWGNGPKME
jgi:hypothetical protein